MLQFVGGEPDGFGRDLAGLVYGGTYVWHAYPIDFSTLFASPYTRRFPPENACLDAEKKVNTQRNFCVFCEHGLRVNLA